MDGVMTGAADDQGLALSCGHDLDPDRLVPSPFLLQVSELADMVDFAVLRCSADLASVREEPFDQLVAVRPEVDGAVVDEGGCLPASERYAPETCYQWLLAGAFHSRFQALHRAVRRRYRAAVPARHRRHTRFVLVRQRLEQGRLHHPMEFPQPANVVGQEVVL